MKLGIDAFRKTHSGKLETLRDKLGIKATSSQFEQIIKSKPGSREYQAAAQHRSMVDKTEALARANRDMEEQIGKTKANVEDDE